MNTESNGILETVANLIIERKIGGDNWKRKHPTACVQPDVALGTRLRKFKKNQRNKPCHCGSGVKSKHCCVVFSEDLYDVVR